MDFFDLHCDTAYRMYLENQGFVKNKLAVSAKKARIFENWIETFAIFVREETETPFSFYKNVLKNLKSKLTDDVTPIYALEGGTVIENTDTLYELKQDEIRFITLTWNGENKIAGGVNSQKGLSDFGKAVISKMNELNISVDLSHLNEKSFYDVIAIAKKPLATHSNCRAICEHKRNLSDEQIKLIVQKGGIIGLNFYPAFLGGDFSEKIYQNIFHLCDMGFENNIAIGSDFDGADMSREMTDISKIPSLFKFLQKKGLTERLLNKIFFKNANDFVLNL